MQERKHPACLSSRKLIFNLCASFVISTDPLRGLRFGRGSREAMRASRTWNQMTKTVLADSHFVPMNKSAFPFEFVL